VVEGTNLIIISPNNKTLKGCIIGGQVKKATKKAIGKAVEMGIKV
jgi:hypothetical protein